MGFCTLDQAQERGLRIIHDLRVNARAAGPRLGKQVQFVIKASKAGAWREEDGRVVVQTTAGDVALEPTEYHLDNRIEQEDGAQADQSASAALPTGGFVILDTRLTDDLLAEGYARDLIRQVQDARKAADLDIADRISLTLTLPAADAPKAEQFQDLISQETLATNLEVKAADGLTEPQVDLAKA